MSYTQQKPLPPIGPPDLPQDIISLARQIVRDCVSPGRYAIFLDVPHYPSQPKTALIVKQETIRMIEMKRP